MKWLAKCRSICSQSIKPFVTTNLKTLVGVGDVVKFIEIRGMLKKQALAVG